MKVENFKKFTNGIVYLLKTWDDYPLEVTDTFLPYYTKDAIGKHQNCLKNSDIGSRQERWMVGVSTMSGCPVGCKFCATGKLKKCRNLTSDEIIDQVRFIWNTNAQSHAKDSKEFKINYTRMGEPFLNIKNVRESIEHISSINPNTHHYVSTIGIKGSDFSWVKGNISLQFSIHSFDENYRNWLIPYKNKMTLQEIGQVRTGSNLKTTLNLTLTRPEDFDINKLKKYFDPEYFFIKLSPINPNDISNQNGLDDGVIHQENLI